MKKYLLGFILTVMIFLMVPVSSVFANQAWVYSKDMTDKRIAFGVATVNGTIYRMGGYDGLPSNKVEVYNPVTNNWTTKPNMLAARAAFGTAVVNGKIYAIGGFNGDLINLTGGSNLSNVEEYDPVNEKWTNKASIPVARSWTSAIAYKGKIYVFGGATKDSHVSNHVYVYDTATDTWTSMKSMPVAMHAPASVVVNDRIYLVGGDSGRLLNTLWEYNPESDSWVQKADMINVRDALEVIYFNGKIYAIGGINGSRSGGTNAVELYDVSTNTWTTGPNMNEYRWGFGVSLVAGKIFAFGGGTTVTNFTKTVEILTVLEATIAPVNLMAKFGNSTNSLSWDPATGATSYNIKRSTTAGGPYTTIATSVTGTTYADKSVTNGTTYYYVVTAVNAEGEGSNSNEASATPTAPPVVTPPVVTPPVVTPVTPTPTTSTGNRALLVITLVSGLEKEYDLPMSEINSFTSWYAARAAGSGLEVYTINKSFNKASFLSRKDNIAFDKIELYEVNEYTSAP